jgi:hypothetical protein
MTRGASADTGAANQTIGATSGASARHGCAGGGLRAARGGPAAATRAESSATATRYSAISDATAASLIASCADASSAITASVGSQAPISLAEEKAAEDARARGEADAAEREAPFLAAAEVLPQRLHLAPMPI